jgi:hypothetical protein
VVIVAPEPRMPNIEATLDAAEIVIEDKLFATDAARKFGPGYFYLSCFVSRQARVCDGNPPQASGAKNALAEVQRLRIQLCN